MKWSQNPGMSIPVTPSVTNIFRPTFCNSSGTCQQRHSRIDDPLRGIIRSSRSPAVAMRVRNSPWLRSIPPCMTSMCRSSRFSCGLLSGSRIESTISNLPDGSIALRQLRNMVIAVASSQLCRMALRILVSAPAGTDCRKSPAMHWQRRDNP